MQKIKQLLLRYFLWRHREGHYFVARPDLHYPNSMDALPFEILRGKWKGIVFQFVDVDVTGGLRFSSKILRLPPGKKSIYTTKSYHKVIEKIMMVVMWNIHNGDGPYQMGLKPGEEYEDRTDYPEESIAERSVRGKGHPVPEE